jgi:superfamily II DNA or RNA helicase
MSASPTPAWIRLLSLVNLVTAFSREVVLNALMHPYQYKKAPASTEGHTLVATFHTDLADPAWFLSKNIRDNGIEVRVNLVSHNDDQMRIVASCDCNKVGSRCAHISALMVDLAVQPQLVDAIVGNKDSSEALAALPRLRAHARAELIAQSMAASWFDLPPAHTTKPWEIRLVFHDVRPWKLSGHRDDPDFPYLELRLTDPESKTLLDPREVHARPLPALERRIFTLGTPLPRGRKGVLISGLHASLALRMLRDARREVFVGEKGKATLVFSDQPVTVCLVRAKLVRASSLKNPSAATVEVDVIEGRWRSHGADPLDVPSHEAVMYSGVFPFLWVGLCATLYPIDVTVDLDVAWALHCAPTQEFSPQHAATVYRGLQRALSGRTIGLPPPETMGLTPRSEAIFSLRIEGSAFHIKARLEASYDFGDLEVGPTGALASVSLDQDLRRNIDHEMTLVSRVLGSGLRWDDSTQCFVAADREAAEFWSKGIVELRVPHVHKLGLYIAEGLRKVVVRPPVKASVRVSMSDGNMLETEFSFEAGELSADIDAVREALRSKRRWLSLDDGSISEIQDNVAAVVEELGELLPSKGEKHSKGRRMQVSLPAHQLGRVDRWLDAGIGGDVDPAVENFRARMRTLAVKAEPELPKGLEATLRPYQLQGVAWLQFLSELGVGGILADDMGLGKTLTALAVLLWQRERNGSAPSLVVCPTSVASTWMREAARFAPSLKVVLYHGHAREKDPELLKQADLVVTTYALLRRDATMLAGISFRYAILDEAQYIKNASSQITQAARDLIATHRLALSGTPVENHLGELWSIMDFCNAGMLGTPREFSTRYERSIALEPRGEISQRLRSLVRPFVLRRTKREVLKDLPPKQEIDQVCTPTITQRKLYDALSYTVLAEVEQRIADVGMARAGLNILTAMLRLRQMACDPRLIDATLPKDTSAKRNEFLTLVRGLVDEGRRALVFSQFVGLLSLWRSDLDDMGIAYEYLDGSTRDRDAAVQRFQKGSAPLFLISLKAGGTGLTLTAADTVIHCDPWWNPAVEDQATDRAHRFGQTRSVTVYRLLTQGTLEERILALKNRKRDLASAVIAEDAGALQGLTQEDVRMLLGRSDADDEFEEDDSATTA